MQPTSTFVVLSAAGPNRDLTKPTREQPWWDDHAVFIDKLVDDGVILLGGPLPDEGGAMIVVRAATEGAVADTLRADPWYQQGVLKLVAIKRWEIFIDQRA